MLPTTLLSLSLAVTSSLAGPTYRSILRPRQDSHGTPQIPDAGSRVKVYWAIISKDDTLIGGEIPDDKIDEQMQILNSDFAPVGMSFELVKTQRIRNATMFDLQDTSRKEIFKEITDPSIMKIWSRAQGASSSPYPENYHQDPESDGITLGINAIKDLGSFGSKGHVLTHEAGHWSGLIHTFEGGCEAGEDEGDKVKDTPRHINTSDDCDKPVYTCGGPDPDPTDNFMSYSPDRCRTRFTPGQIERMRTELKKYRGITLGAAVNRGTTPTTSTSISGNTTEVTAGGTGNMTGTTSGENENTPTNATVSGTGTSAGNTTEGMGNDNQGTNSTPGGTSLSETGNTITETAGGTKGTAGSGDHEGGTGGTAGSGDNEGGTGGTAGSGDNERGSGGRAGSGDNERGSGGRVGSGGNELGSGGTAGSGDNELGSGGRAGSGDNDLGTGGETETTGNANQGTADGTSSTETTDALRAKARSMYKNIMDSASKLWEFMNKNELV